ncbi:MAG: molybdenum cofactor guanylyltransferase [Planctomycetes bacterium]|nr:molybdenum cofactor guanylyltransferase [Planctomycetota bacterium]
MTEQSKWPHTGAILAGGKSSRIGSPKHALKLPNGLTMIETVAAAMRQVCDRIVVVSSFETLDDVKHIADLRDDQGPLAGIEALLASGMDTHYLVCPCDLPFVNGELLRALTKSSSAAATVLSIEGFDDRLPLPARISVAALDNVRELLDAGRRAVFRLMQKIDVEEVGAVKEWFKLLANVNTLADYEKAVREFHCN